MVFSVPGAIDKSQTDKLFVEKYDATAEKGLAPITIPASDVTLKTGVFVGQCKGPDFAVIIEGKTVTTEQIKNLTISGCENIGVVVDDIVTTVEIINCKKVQVQAKNSAGSWIVDKCDRTTIYLPEGSVKDKAVVVSCMSSATNVLHSTPGGEDMVENAIPEQIQSTFTLGAKPVHEVVIPDAE